MSIGAALRENLSTNKPTLVRQIRKLGDYYGAAKSITEALTDPVISQLKTRIHFIEVNLSPLLYLPTTVT